MDAFALLLNKIVVDSTSVAFGLCSFHGISLQMMLLHQFSDDTVQYH